MGLPDYKQLTLPEQRTKGNRWRIFYVFVFLLYLGGAMCLVCFTINSQYDRYIYAAVIASSALYGFLAVMFGELLAKIGQLLNEHQYLHTRYADSCAKLFRKGCLLGGCRYYVGIITCLICLATICFGYRNGSSILWEVLQKHWFLFISIIVFKGAIVPLICLDGISPVEAPILGEAGNLNCAHGLAWSFYFGYLRLILPGLQERISNLEWWNCKKGKMVAKLFILLPQNCFTPPTLSDEDKNIQHMGTTDPVLANRAGAVRRPYTNQVYSVENPENGEFYFCVVEYATPLLSLFEMCNSKEAGLSQGQMEEQMHVFYRTLKNILDKSPFGSNVILLPYKETDESGQKIRLSTFLCSAIEEEYHLWGKEQIY